MQSKINSFFNLQSSNSSESPYSISEEEDDDKIAKWEKRQHKFVATYKRRTPRIDDRVSVDGTEIEASKVSNFIGKTLNKKRSYAQFHLDLGQSDFLLRTCSVCGMKYAPGDQGDEKNHNTFHKSYTHGVQFKGWRNERVVDTVGDGKGRIVMVLDGDPIVHRKKVEEVVKIMEIELGQGWMLHKSCKVYLFITGQRVGACLVAEPIKEAFKVISCLEKERQRRSSVSTRKESTLRFGQIVFHREIIKKDNIDKLDGDAIVCDKEAKAAVCGIRAIWVSPFNRKQGLATQLLETLRKSFIEDCVIQKSDMAFSQPSSTGKAFASYYFGTRSFFIYKPQAANQIE